MIRLPRMRPAATCACVMVACATCSAPTPQTASTSPVERIDSEGLLCVRYTLDTDAPRMEAVAASYATRLYPNPAERAALAREGLQVAIVPTRELPDIRARLGPLSEVTRVIVGQSANWIEVARRDLREDELVNMGGRLMRGNGSSLRLSVRDAVTPTAEGGCVHTEAVLHLAPTASPLPSVAGGPPAGTVVDAASLECCLQDDETLLILPAPSPPSGKGPATAVDLPPTPGVALLAERSPLDAGKDRRGYSIAIALIAKVPAGIRPPPAEPLDTAPPIHDTAPDAPAATSP